MADQNTITNVEIPHNKGGMDVEGLMRQKYCFLALIWAGAIEDGLNKDLLPLLMKRAWALNRNHEEIVFFPFISQKTLKAGELVKTEGGSDTIAENKSWPLDLAKVDPTVAINITILQLAGSSTLR